MPKRKPTKPDPAENFGIDAAREGDPEGVMCFAMFVERIAMELSGFTPLPPLIKFKLADIRKSAAGLAEFAHGYSVGAKTVKAE